jgi:hypothetical protein
VGEAQPPGAGALAPCATGAPAVGLTWPEGLCAPEPGALDGEEPAGALAPPVPGAADVPAAGPAPFGTELPVCGAVAGAVPAAGPVPGVAAGSLAALTGVSSGASRPPEVTS